MPSEWSDLVQRAMSYPYPAPARPFVQHGHDTLDPGEVEFDWSERVPLLAYGSNASPAALGHKLAISDDPVLVLPGWLREFDIVYSAHISPYGAVPATLQRSPETVVRIHVAYMTSKQLTLVSATEPNYELGTLESARCELDDGTTIAALSAYASRHGCLLIDGAEVALSAAPAQNRRFGELSEPEVLEHVRSALCPVEGIEDFVRGNVTDPDLAQSRSARLPRRVPSPSLAIRTASNSRSAR